VTGARVVKAYSREQAAIAEFEVGNQNLRAAATMAQTYALVLAPLTNMVNNMGFAVVVGVGGWMAIQGLATVGTIAAFVNYARQFGRPLNQLANLYNTIQSALAGAERVFEILDENPEMEDISAGLPLDSIAGDVVFESVRFGYNKQYRGRCCF